ncbi:MAG: nickel pincer cofactor biosynthesis protein LarB [Gammaproteobacteria bacterium]
MTSVHDHGRRARIGLPEAVLCEGKDADILCALVADLARTAAEPVLLTRLAPEIHARMDETLRARLDYEPVSRTAFLGGRLAPVGARVVVVTAGTADLAPAREAARTLEYLGIEADLIADVGVAGIWRLMQRVEDIQRGEVVIVVAGMDAALVSVVAGLVPQPVIGVPTSVGYGVASGGQTALNAMLASCAQGVMVTNIDNGFGAACAAARVLNRLRAARG